MMQRVIARSMSGMRRSGAVALTAALALAAVTPIRAQTVNPWTPQTAVPQAQYPAAAGEGATAWAPTATANQYAPPGLEAQLSGDGAAATQQTSAPLYAPMGQAPAAGYAPSAPQATAPTYAPQASVPAPRYAPAELQRPSAPQTSGAAAPAPYSAQPGVYGPPPGGNGLPQGGLGYGYAPVAPGGYGYPGALPYGAAPAPGWPGYGTALPYGAGVPGGYGTGWPGGYGTGLPGGYGTGFPGGYGTGWPGSGWGGGWPGTGISPFGFW